MKLQLGKKIKEQNPKNIWRITVETMTPMFTWKKFNLDFSDESEFKEVVRYCKVMDLHPVRADLGRKSGFYDYLDFFNKYFNEKWHYEYGESMNCWYGFSLTYFDETGEEIEVIYTLSDEDKKIISSYGVKKGRRG
jgi:hypothetical protein